VPDDFLVSFLVEVEESDDELELFSDELLESDDFEESDDLEDSEDPESVELSFFSSPPLFFL